MRSVLTISPHVGLEHSSIAVSPTVGRANAKLATHDAILLAGGAVRFVASLGQEIRKVHKTVKVWQGSLLGLVVVSSVRKRKHKSVTLVCFLSCPSIGPLHSLLSRLTPRLCYKRDL